MERIGRRQLTYRSVSAKGRWRTGTRTARLSRVSRISLWDPSVETIRVIAGA